MVVPVEAFEVHDVAGPVLCGLPELILIVRGIREHLFESLRLEKLQGCASWSIQASYGGV